MVLSSVKASSNVIAVGDSGSVSGILAELVEANTVPAERDADGNETKAAVVPVADTLAIEVRTTPLEIDEDGNEISDSRPLLQTHAWRLPKARADRLDDIRVARNAKLFKLDEEANQALTGRPGVRAVVDVEAARQVLRDLPPVAEAALAGLNDTDAITAYQPSELE